MLKLNENLLNDLPRLMGERVVDFTNRIFGPNKKFRWVVLKKNKWNTMQCTDLVRIANAYHIPLCHLFHLEDDETVYTDKAQFVLDGEWTDIEVHPDNICKAYRSPKPKYMLKDFAANIGTTTSSIYRWFAPGGKCTITVNEALTMTFNMNLPLSFLFIDNNAPLPFHLRLNTTEGHERTVSELKTMRAKIQAQQRKINQMEQEAEKRKNNDTAIDGMLREEEMDYGEYTTRVRPFRFNQVLWDNLHIVVGTSKRELERITGVRTVIATPTVLQLVNVCNALEISTHHFILRSVTVPELRSADHYRGQFSTVHFDPTKLECLFGVGNILNRKRKDILEILDVNDMMTRRWVKPDSHITVSKLVEMCNELDITPSICITDDNSRPYGTTLTEMLLEENIILRQKLASK